MFTKTIGKKCRKSPEECNLSGQLQDSGLIICPECGSDLVVVTVADQRMRAALFVVLAVAGAVLGMSTYGMVAKGLGPVGTVRWVLRQIELNDSLYPADATEWVSGGATFYDKTTVLPIRRDAFLYEVKGGRRTSTFRTLLDGNTMMRFDLTAVSPEVSSLYLVYLGEHGARILYAADTTPAASPQAPLSIPAPDKLIQLQGGAATEHFVLIASRKQLSSLAALAGKAMAAPDGGTGGILQTGDLDAAMLPLEKDKDAYVLHVFIPHS